VRQGDTRVPKTIPAVQVRWCRSSRPPPGRPYRFFSCAAAKVFDWCSCPGRIVSGSDAVLVLDPLPCDCDEITREVLTCIDPVKTRTFEPLPSVNSSIYVTIISSILYRSQVSTLTTRPIDEHLLFMRCLFASSAKMASKLNGARMKARGATIRRMNHGEVERTNIYR
jgi:hypothetical protein